MEIESKDGIRAHYRREREREREVAVGGKVVDDGLTTSTTGGSEAGEGEGEGEGDGLPPLKYGTVADAVPAEWVKVDAERVGTFFAGNVSLNTPLYGIT